jgi:uncharacterized protein with ParB-like and HNH nuclease domain
MKSDYIDVAPDFQRNEVWNDHARARFIDSLAKEFPIPSMCFALYPKEQKYIVIDGLQRMSSIRKFFENLDWKLPKLDDIDKRLYGKTNREISKASPEIIRKIENVSLPITILRYDPEKEDNMEYIFTIFQRINTYGERLKNQEIRNAIYQGEFNSFLKEMSNSDAWEKFVGTKKKQSKKRGENEEDILRFFAFYENTSKYNGKLNMFLNQYMQKNRHNSDNEKLRKLFQRTFSVANNIKRESLASRPNAVRDTILYAIAKNIDRVEKMESAEIEKRIDDLLKNSVFEEKELQQAEQMRQHLHAKGYNDASAQQAIAFLLRSKV